MVDSVQQASSGIHRGGRLLRAAPEQLRHASQREQWIEELKGPVELPWTITSLASSGVRRGYIDISHDIPEEDVWMESHDVPPEEPNLDDDIPQKRMRVKGSGYLGVRKSCLRTARTE